MDNTIYERILNEVLEKIKPAEKPMEADEFVAKLNKKLKKKKIKATAMIGGSFAKNTYLKNKHDIDIFVKFNLKYKNKDISRMLGKALKGFRASVVHGSRDYYQIKSNRLTFEIVPVLAIKKPEEAQNVTDFSPLHVKWVAENIANLNDDIRLAKKFCMAQKVYGAESYINGFSGHVIDILIIYYKGFIPLLKAAVRWQQRKVIDFYNMHKGKALETLNKSKIECPLIIIDPVQPDRNAATALGLENFKKFRETAKQFLKNPSRGYFEERAIDVKQLKKKKAVIIQAEPKNGKYDVAGAKLLKAFEFFKKHLQEFRIIEAVWEWDRKKKAVFAFIVAEERLDREKIQEGPPLKEKECVKRFRQKHPKTFIEKGRVYAKVKRSFIKPRALVRALFKEEYIRNRVKKCLLI